MKYILLLFLSLFYPSTGGSFKDQYPGLPDPFQTPGAINTSVTQKDICNPKWSTDSIRPPVSYTNKLKREQLTSSSSHYRVSGSPDLSLYEEDHLISLELGGSPTDSKNLWPEPYAGDLGARTKDKVENYLHKQVCLGKITLLQAQQEISVNWVTVYKDMSK